MSQLNQIKSYGVKLNPIAILNPLFPFLFVLLFFFLYNIVLEFFIFIFFWALEAIDLLNRNFIFF